jgi:hypothetical protein
LRQVGLSRAEPRGRAAGAVRRAETEKELRPLFPPWDARDLHPIKQGKIIPPELTTSNLEELRKNGIWDKILKDVPDNNLEGILRERLAREVADEMIEKRITKKLKKSAAKEIAKEWLRRSPLAILFVGVGAREAFADYQNRGAPFAVCNQLFPADLIEEVAGQAGGMYDEWLEENPRGILRKKFDRWGVDPPGDE